VGFMFKQMFYNNSWYVHHFQTKLTYLTGF
jgi:hypothetical protein